MKQRIIIIAICIASFTLGIAYLKSQSTNLPPTQTGGSIRTKTNVVNRVIRHITEYEEIVSTVPMQTIWWIEGGTWYTGNVEYAVQPEEILSRTLKTNIVNAPTH